MQQQSLQGEDKALDSTSALQKVLRLDKKHTNFDYVDSLRGVTLKIGYPQIQPQGPSSETLLKSLWRHACNYYFKPIEDGELRRLHYIKDVVSANCEGNYRFEESEEFWTAVESLYSHEYLHKYLKGESERLQLHNSLEMMHIVWSMGQCVDVKSRKRRQLLYEQLVKDIGRIWGTQYGYRQKLQMESKRLKEEIVNPSDPNNQINQEIAQLQRELRETTREVVPILKKLQQRVTLQATVQDVLFCQNGPGDQSELMVEGVSRVDRKLSKLQSFQLLARYIEYTISDLQRKQIAQSVSKLLRVQRGKGQYRFTLAFEQAMGIRPISVSEQQFKGINDLREYSLLKFYNTASKSPYTFICQNGGVNQDDQFVCERRYCRYCLKNYEESKDKAGGLCPYCRGICYCTRCSRNDTIVRLKSLYVLLGGDINRLQEGSLFERYYEHPEDAIALRRKEKSHKSSKRSGSAPSRLNEKMLNIRYQLQDLRLICGLVKRREKSKQKLHSCLKEAFQKKVELIDPDFRLQRPGQSRSLQQSQGREGREQRTGAAPITLSEKMAKKLRRMIS